MKTCHQLLIAVMLLCFSVSTGCGQQKDTTIKHIRQLFQRINSDHTLKTLELGEEAFPEMENEGAAPDGGVSMTASYKKDTVYKIKIWIGVSYCVREYEYYFSDGKLFFIYETEKDFPGDGQGALNYEKLVLAFEGRYYINDGKIVDIKVTGKKRGGAKTTAATVQALMANADSYVKTVAARLKKMKAGK